MARQHRAFTLIEMLGVIAIMALLSAAASVMLSGPRHEADLQDGIEQIQQADLSSRTLARQSDEKISLTINVSQGRLIRVAGTAETLLGNLPGDVKIERVRAGSAAIDFGSPNIDYSKRGCSNSYAVRLASSAGEKQWIVFAGLTGQMLKVDDQDVDDIFQEVSGSNGPDAR